MSEPEKKKPDLYPENAPFWEAAAAGKLLLRHCKACDRLHHYPRQVCPFCYSLDLDWRESSGKGVVYSFTGLERGPPGVTPAIVGYVTLEEGPTVFVNLIETTLDALTIGAAVKGSFRPRPNSPNPALVFQPV